MSEIKTISYFIKTTQLNVPTHLVNNLFVCNKNEKKIFYYKIQKYML